MFWSCHFQFFAKDWHLALGVLTMVLIDLTILLVYTIVEGIQGNLTAIRVPNRENPRVVQGVGWYVISNTKSVDLLCNLYIF